MKANRIVRQAVHAVTTCNFTTYNRSDNTVNVRNWQDGMHMLLALNSRLTNSEQLRYVQRAIQAMILRHLAEAAYFFAHIRLVQKRR